jgi:hypothetical protein
MSRGNPRAVTGTHTTPVGDELMVHVVGSVETHLLSPTTAAVWQRCDGASSRSDLETVFAEQPAELRPELVQLALDQLEKAGLVEDGGHSSDLQRESRRRFLRRAAIAAVAVPAITTVVTQQPAAAASAGSPCTSNLDCVDAGLTCIANTCQPLSSNGGPCDQNGATGDHADCQSPLLCSSGTCRSAIGGSCSGDSQCVGGAYCDAFTSTCLAKRPDGVSCTRSGQCVNSCCRSNVCRSGGGSCAPT